MRHVLRTAAALVALAPFGLLAASPASAWDRNRPRTIEIANLNILHGFACDPATPGDGDQCRVSDRIDLLIRHIEAIGCPDLVTLQENVTGEFVQLDTEGIVDPAKVARCALQNAGALGGLVLTTDALVVDNDRGDKPEPGAESGE